MRAASAFCGVRVMRAHPRMNRTCCFGRRFLSRDWRDEGEEGDFLLNRAGFASFSVMFMLLFSIFVIILHGQLVPMVRTGLPYWFMTGAYVNVLQVSGRAKGSSVALLNAVGSESWSGGASFGRTDSRRCSCLFCSVA